jgi:hypothetical protein
MGLGGVHRLNPGFDEYRTLTERRILVVILARQAVE